MQRSEYFLLLNNDTESSPGLPGGAARILYA